MHVLEPRPSSSFSPLLSRFGDPVFSALPNAVFQNTLNSYNIFVWVSFSILTSTPEWFGKASLRTQEGHS
jgi:hypothetical protein